MAVRPVGRISELRLDSGGGASLSLPHPAQYLWAQKIVEPKRGRLCLQLGWYQTFSRPISWKLLELEVEKHLVSDNTLLRPNDLKYSSMDPKLIHDDLGWKAKTVPREIVQKMYDESV